MTDLDAARDFLLLNARLIDRVRFAHLFEGAAREPVLAALRAYRNDDGGFGHGLEPDIRAPDSQPGAVNSALEILEETQASDDPMVGAACDWLASVSNPDGGVPFALASLEGYPRAPWWQASEESSLTITGLLASQLHRAGSSHPWLEGATEFCFARAADPNCESAYELRGLVAFLDAVPDRDRAQRRSKRSGPA